MNNHEKGLVYEHFVKHFIIQELQKNAYLWNECPENILIDNALIGSHNDMRLTRKDIKEGIMHHHKDIGIDIIQMEDDEKCTIVQCKNGYMNGITIENVAGIMLRTAFMKDIDTYIYYTTKLSRNIRYTAMFSSYAVMITDLQKLKDISCGNKVYFVKLPYAEDNEKADVGDSKECIPYVYQTEAVQKFKEHFAENKRGILSLPCGCGKTFVGYLISNTYKHIVIISPLREFASQNLNRFIEYGYDADNTMLVDSDGNRDIDSVKTFISKHQNLLISCTYDSMDIISECLDDFKDSLFIIDEFHNLSRNNISDDTNDIFRLLASEHRILFMSATPRIYDIEYEDEAYDTELLFGKVVYNMTMSEAIQNKYICDYKLWLPSIHENNQELDKELSIYEIDNELKNRCKFLYSCICNNGSRKCIVYCKDTNDMLSMMNCMQTLNEFYLLDIEFNSICCQDNEKKRKECLKTFAEHSSKIKVLFNIKILNECIDIPVCDSIYISYPPKNKITTIQRICRANRVDKTNPRKIANIYIWCNVYEEILDTLSSIKEYDVMFKDKVKINSVDFYSSKDEKNLDLIKQDKELVKNYTLGVKEFQDITWQEKLQMVKDYIHKYNRTPSSTDKIVSIRQLACWFKRHKQFYNNNMYMYKNPDVRKIWDAFMCENYELLKSDNEIWKCTFSQVEDYVSKKNKFPSSESKDENIKKLGIWVLAQKSNYKSKTNNMKRPEIKQIWEEFMYKNPKLFRNNQEKWVDYLHELDVYIQKYDKLPSEDDKDKEVSILASWVYDQKYRYKKQTCIMKDESIRKQWLTFTEKYAKYFMSNEEVWKEKLAQVQTYAVQNDGKLPYLTDSNTDVKMLAKWLYHQAENYKDNKQSLSNPELRAIWEDFIKKYPCRKFMTTEEYWLQTFKQLEEYVSVHNKLPSDYADTKKLATWMKRQRQNYETKKEAMGKPGVRIYWENFTLKYKHLF
jgi:superfamily II DNA or RNA helicase